MKPRIKLAAARTPDGGEMALYQHDHDFSIIINGKCLMDSRRHESELELARLGCAHISGLRAPNILIGGLGMGYTLRQTLNIAGPHANVLVVELLNAVVDWNRRFLGELNGQPLADIRVDLRAGDIVELISCSRNKFDAILLDIDNGPEAITDSGNFRLYNREGILACRRALRRQGCLAVWSARPDRGFEHLLRSCGFHVHRFQVPTRKGSKTSYSVWVASENKASLPENGSEPHLPHSSRWKKNRKRPGKRQYEK